MDSNYDVVWLLISKERLRKTNNMLCSFKQNYLTHEQIAVLQILIEDKQILFNQKL